MQTGSVAAGLWSWSKERFPAINLFSSFILYFLVAAAVRSEAVSGVYLVWEDIFAALALYFHFLVLRVLDEHKDYSRDLITHPQRVLQRGLVTLSQLRLLGVFAALVTLTITLLFNSQSSIVLGAWAVVMIWTLFMSVEFFCGRWLNKHLLLYSVTHMLILPMMIFWAGLMAEPASWNTPVLMWILIFTFINGLIYEVIRKMKGKDEQIAEEPSFTKELGFTLSTSLVFILISASFLSFVLGLRVFYTDNIVYLLPASLMLLALAATIYKFKSTPVKKYREMSEGLSALFVLVLYSSVIIAAYAG